MRPKSAGPTRVITLIADRQTTRRMLKRIAAKGELALPNFDSANSWPCSLPAPSSSRHGAHINAGIYCRQNYHKG